MKETLYVLFGDVPVGSLVYDRKRDEISLEYEESWQFGAASFPMSLSLPLAKRTHPDESIRPFLQGLLPDNPAVIEAWGKRFQVSPRNPLDIIKQVGEDCAGALQFVRPDRLGLILSGALDSLTPLSEDDLAMRMSDLKSQARSIPIQIEGRFSLAGAQTKDALHLKNGQWFVPAGRIPSTHILKPQLDEFEEHALNEHFCLQLASKIGGSYRLHEIDVAHWEKWAVEAGLSFSWVKSHVETLIRSVMDSLEPTRDAIAGKNDSPFLQKLADSIAESTRKCAELMDL